jgi:hypothetical protein
MRLNHGFRLSSPIVVPLLMALVLSIALVGTTSAKGRPGGGGGGGGKTCTHATPGVAVDNNWAWSGWGSWGYPGQQLTYAINVINYDTGCAADTFLIDVQAPSGFAVSVPTTSVSLKAGTNAYLWAYVTSPSSAMDGNYPLIVSVTRAGTTSPVGSFTSYYKVYTTDTADPTLFWANPGEGQVLDARTVDFTASSSDDHAVQKMDLFVDGSFVATTTCDGVTYICQLSATWSATTGSHTATFVSYDWFGNSGSLSVAFTVGSGATSATVTSTTSSAPTAERTTSGTTETVHGKSADHGNKSIGQGNAHGPGK